jgi:hypothetical protein
MLNRCSLKFSTVFSIKSTSSLCIHSSSCALGFLVSVEEPDERRDIVISSKLIDMLIDILRSPRMVLLGEAGSTSIGVVSRTLRAWRCRLSMSRTESTVQKVPVRPQPAEQWTRIGRASSGSGPEGEPLLTWRHTASHCSMRPRRWVGCAGAPKSGQCEYWS